MSGETDVSVVMPTCNGAAFVGDALQSLRDQTVVPRELIVVDDGSRDQTREIVEQFAARAPMPVRIVRLPESSGGPGKPLNVGIRQASSELVAVLEQDDRMCRGRLQQQCEALAAHPEASVAIGCYEVFGDFAPGELPWYLADPQFAHLDIPVPNDAPCFLIPPAIAYRGLLQRNFAISNSNLCFLKAVWERVGGFSQSLHTVSDLDFLLRAVTLGPVAVVPHTLLLYRWRSDSLNRACDKSKNAQHNQILIEALAARPDWVQDKFWTYYFKLQRRCRNALRRGHFREAAYLAWGLLRIRMCRKRAQRSKHALGPASPCDVPVTER